MRLSASDHSPFYFSTIIRDLGGDPYALSIRIDGENLDTGTVVEADDVEGWADTLYYSEDVDAKGRKQFALNETGNGLAIKRVTGRVEFLWPIDHDGSNDGITPHETTARFSENYTSGLDGTAP